MFRKVILVLGIAFAVLVLISEAFKKSVKRDAEAEAKAFAEREGRWP